MGRALDSRSKGLGFNSHCWSCAVGQVSHAMCLCPSSSNGHLEERKKLNSNDWLLLHKMSRILFRDEHKRVCSNTRGVIEQSTILMEISGL